MVTSPRLKWLALALLAAVQFMVVLDIAIVNVALPSIQTDLGFSQANLQWVISAYALVFGGFLLLGGRAADILGRRRIFMVGLIAFTIGSLLCGLAWSEASLIAARAIQGLGAATISPAALAILMTTFAEGRERNIALGVWGAVGGFGAAAGVLLGGVLTDALSWEWIFFVNIPVGLAALALAPVLLTESRDTQGEELRCTRGGARHERAVDRHARDHPRAQLGLGLGSHDRRLRAHGGAPRRLRRLGEPCQGAADALRDPPHQDGAGRERGRLHPRHGAVLDVPDADALHAAGARVLGDEDGRRVPRGRRDLDHLGERRRDARGQGRRPAADRERDGNPRGRPAPVLTGLGRRLVRVRSAARLPDRRARDGALLRADLDRGPRRRQQVRSGTRFRADQHVAAGRRRGRDRTPLDDRDLSHRQRGRGRHRACRRRSRRASSSPS